MNFKSVIIFNYIPYLCSLILFVVGYFFWIKDKNNNELEKQTSNHKLSKIDVLFCVCLSLSLVSFFNSFPLMGIHPYSDSAVFKYVGEQMHNGLLPYKDIFDHKGIFLYIIEYIAVGLVPGTYWGLYIVESINMIFLSIFSLKILSFYTKNNVLKYVTLFSVLFGCGIGLFQGGNMTEEYAVSWIALSFYIFLKYFETKKYRFIDIVLLGIGFSAVALLRVNMVVVWLIFIPAVLISLIKDKRGKDIAKCILGFLLGIAISCLPILIYLLKTDNLQNMIDCYITFNMSYTSSEGKFLNLIKAMLEFIIMLLPSVIGVIVSLFEKKKDFAYYCSLILLAFSFVLMSISGRSYNHYAVILLPSLIIPFAMCINVVYNKLSKAIKIKGLSLKPCLVVIASILLLCASLSFNSVIIPRITKVDYDKKIETRILENSNESDDVLLLGNMCRFYSICNRTTSNRFAFQFPPVTVNDELVFDVIDEMEKTNSDLILGSDTKQDALNNEKYGEKYKIILNYLDEKVSNGEYTFEQLDGVFVYKKVVK